MGTLFQRTRYGFDLIYCV